MLPRPDNPGSWKYARRKVSSVLLDRSSHLLHAVFIGFVLGIVGFGTNPVSPRPGEGAPGSADAANNALPTVATVPSARSAGHGTTDAGAATTGMSAASTTPPPPPTTEQQRPTVVPLVVAGVNHPHPEAARAWRAVARNASATPEMVSVDGKDRVALYVLVKSAPTYTERRALCRTHWQWRGADKMPLIPGLVGQQFLIGSSGKDNVEAALLKENQQFSDILRYPGNDTYRRLPWKVLWGMRHVAEKYKFDMLLLMDDDSFLNYPMSLRWTGSQLAERVYAGQLVDMHPKVQRDTKDQWYVPRSIYAPDEYPPYHWGAGYFLSSDLVTAILAESTHHEILWIDDAFMAILLNATGLPINVQDIRVYAVPDWAIFLCCEPSPLVLGSRNVKKMVRVGGYQKGLSPLCRFRRSKHCKRSTSL